MTKAFILFCALTTAILTHAQTDLVCFRNSSTFGGFVYAEIDLANDTVYEKTLLPGFIGSLFTSATADADHSVYYVCDGQRLFGINTITDSVVLNLLLPLSFQDYMTTIQYNACDSTIYGLFTRSSTNQFSAVCSFRPSDSLFTQLDSVSGSFHAGQEGAMDPASNTYFFENGSTSTSFIGGYDIAQDVVLFNTQVSPLNQSIFLRGIAYDCDSARVIGLAVDQSLVQIHLATVDVLTGTLTPLSSTPSANPFYFALGGSALNHSTGMLYYTSGQTSISTYSNSGNYTDDTVSSAAILGIETMTACPCTVTTAIEEFSASKTTVYPNPCSDELMFDVTLADHTQTLRIYTATGQLVYSAVVSAGRNRVDVSAFTQGVYFYSIVNEVNRVSGSFVKE